MTIREFEIVMAGEEPVMMVEVEHQEGKFFQMPKSVYDEQQEAMANYVPTVVGEGDTK